MIGEYIKKNFDEVLEFCGSLSNEHHSVDNIQFILRYSKHKPSKIQGQIFGNKDTSNSIIKLLNASRSWLKISSKNRQREISCERISIQRISMGDLASESKNNVFKIADFEAYEINNIHYINKLEENIERHITFFISGVKRIFNIHETFERSFDGSIKSKIESNKINIDNRVLVEFVPWYFYDKSSDSSDVELTTNIIALHIMTKLSLEEFSNEAFLEFGKTTADNLLSIYSFLSRQWIVWFAYIFQNNEKVHTFYKQSRNTKNIDVYDDTIPIKWKDINKFVTQSMKKYNDILEMGYDINTAITYFISGAEEKYIEAQFTTTFLSLEKIKDNYETINHLQKILPTNKFDKLRKILSMKISEFIEDEEKQINTIDKIAELNRPSIRSTFNKICDTFSINWNDLYPDGNDITIFNTRNKLFHSSKEIDFDYLIYEYKRLQIILIRIILKIFEWDDLSCTSMISLHI